MSFDDTLMMEPLAPDPAPGEEFQGYRLGVELGRGAHGIVFRATKDKDPTPYAIKIIDAQGQPTSFTERVLRECAITTRLRHHGVITVYEAGQVGSRLYIVMEIANGLAGDHYADGSLGWELASRIVCRVAQALGHVYEVGRVIHRDIKPANIVIDKVGDELKTVKVVDFGLSRSLDDGEDDRLTMTGMVLGTPFYISPEQARGERNLTFATDLYSLGATLFVLIAGRPPFVGTNPVEILVQHCQETPPRLIDLVPGVPPAISAVVERCLAKEPEQRWASYEALSEALEEVLGLNPGPGTGTQSKARFVHRALGPTGERQEVPPKPSTSEIGASALGDLLRAKVASGGIQRDHAKQSTTTKPVIPLRPGTPPRVIPSGMQPKAPTKPPSRREPSLRSGTVFAEIYSVIGPLGAGAMGEVYTVHDTMTKTDLALKILSVEDMEKPGVVARFRGEASALATIDHRNFPYFAGSGTHEGRDYLLMELVQGTDLKTWLERHGGRMSEHGALYVLIQLAQAMDRAHAKCGMVHRDIKPANLMLTRTNQHLLKIVDFGISTYIDFGDFEDFSSRKYHYIDDGSQGKAIGTPAYMSPEQCLGEPPSPLMDIYAIGCTFFHLITGQTPYQAPNSGAVMMKHLHAPLPVFDGLADVSSGSAYLLKRCLAKNPRERFKNYKQLEAAVTSAYYSMTTKVRREESGANPSLPPI
jgi:serine/threonine protein kinase